MGWGGARGGGKELGLIQVLTWGGVQWGASGGEWAEENEWSEPMHGVSENEGSKGVERTCARESSARRGGEGRRK